MLCLMLAFFFLMRRRCTLHFLADWLHTKVKQLLTLLSASLVTAHLEASGLHDMMLLGQGTCREEGERGSGGVSGRRG